VSAAAGVALDATANTNLVSNTLNITYDNTRPTVVVSSAVSGTTAASPIPVTFTFSKNVTGFIVGDITVTNGTAGSFVAVSGSVYTAAITPAGIGIVWVSVAANVAQDAALNLNTASNVFSVNYTIPTPQTITFNALTSITYATATLQLTASASSGLPVSYSSSNTAVATVSGNVLTILSAGTVDITATQAGDNVYSAATPVVRTLVINKAPVFASADNLTRAYGDANPALTISYTGLRTGETSAVIDTPPTGSTTAVATSLIGTYPITLAGGLDNNYALTLVNGTLTVAKATLTVTADNKTKLYGDANPALTITYTGFKNGETITVIDTKPTISTTATVTSAVGTYPITVAGGLDNNYTLVLVNGTLTINKATLTATASNGTRAYGAANPVSTITYTGFKNAETAAVIDTPPTVTTTAVATSNIGTYTFVPVSYTHLRAHET
jgi:hypothetical protein